MRLLREQHNKRRRRSIIKYLALIYYGTLSVHQCEVSVRFGHAPLVSYFIYGGYSGGYGGYSGDMRSELEYAIHHGSIPLLDILMAEYRITSHAVNDIAMVSNIQFMPIFLSRYTLSQSDLNHALVCACERGPVETVLLLIQKGADMEYKKGWPLRTASIHGRIAVAVTLLSAGATPTKQAMKRAIRYGYTGMCLLLMSAGLKLPENCLRVAAGGGHAELVKVLLFSGIPVDYDNGCALKNACAYSRTDVLIVLLEAGARIGLESTMNNVTLDYNPQTLIALLKYNKDLAKLVTRETLQRARDSGRKKSVDAVMAALS